MATSNLPQLTPAQEFHTDMARLLAEIHGLAMATGLMREEGILDVYAEPVQSILLERIEAAQKLLDQWKKQPVAKDTAGGK